MVPSEGMMMGVRMREIHHVKEACEIALICHADQSVLYQIQRQELKPFGIVVSINRFEKIITICDPDSGEKFPVSYDQLIVTPKLTSDFCQWLNLLDSATKLQGTVPSLSYPSRKLKETHSLKKADYPKLSIEPQSDPVKVTEELRDRLGKSSSLFEMQITF